ncbi:flagellar biosynthetic protein FliO [Microbulbifer sp. SA54]|uniref:flagellar biosynthetic protein FliO n=1 Tax=Microbulbifer sp. SA54 TaxID=3401577 RepID=UPI003AAC13DF
MNPASATGGESVIGLAMLGKVAGVLLALIALILLCAWLARRLAPGLAQANGGPQLNIVASKALGTREKVVVLQVEDQWLLLGVGGGQINHLHTLPARTPTEKGTAAATNTGSFAERFARALGQNLGGRGKQT